MNFTNPFESSGSWYKANLHCHTTTSDGECSVAERISQYKRQGYNVLAITDHELTNNLTGLSDKDFLVLQGMETHPPCPQGGDLYHLVCLNVPYKFKIGQHMNAETRICMVRHAGGAVIMGHPYWCGHNINHLMAIDGYIGIEVYNGTATKIGKELSSVHWDGLLDAGRFVGAVASDDTHRGRDIFMGWTMIKAQRLTPEDIISSLQAGCYYATCGPVIEKVSIVGTNVCVNCSDAAAIHFMSRRSHGLSVYAQPGSTINSAQCCVKDLQRYVRVEIVDSASRRAWTNPIIL
jgi:hypothetical protein